MKNRVGFGFLCALTIGTLPARPAEDAITLNEQALVCLEQKDYDKAIELLERATSAAPDDATIAKNLAVAHNNRGLRLLDSFEFSRAIRDFDSAVKLLDAEPLFRVHLGYAYLKSFDFGRAEAVLEETRRKYPREPKAYDYLGFLYYSDDELAKAVELWEQRIALDIDDGEPWTENMLAKARRELAVSSDFVHRTNNDFVLKTLGEEKNLDAADAILKLLEDARARIGSDLSWFPQRRTIVLLYTSEEFRKATGAHEWVGGLYDGKIRLQVRDFARQHSALTETIRHEYTHRVLAEMAPDLPIWLNEGLAEWYGNGGAHAHEPIRALAKEGKEIPAFIALPKTFAQQQDVAVVRLQYAASYSFVTFLRDRYGIAAIREILLGIRRGATIDEAMTKVIGGDVAEMDALWRREILS
jgi:tetratricopeptide (TPR) repeat protein